MGTSFCGSSNGLCDMTCVTWLSLAGLIVTSSLSAQELKWDSTAKRHAGEISSVAWSPDGKTLASGSVDDTVKLWDVASGKSIATLKAEPVEYELSHVTSVAWSPDGETLASASFDTTIRLWDMTSRTNTATLEGHTDWVESVAWSPDGKTLASASVDKTCRLWDVASRRNTATLEGHTLQVNSVTWSPDGKQLASASSDATIRLWDVSTGKNSVTMKPPEASDVISAVAFSPDGETLASTEYRGTFLWDVATGTHTTTLTGHSHRGLGVSWPYDFCVAFNGNGTALATGSADKSIELWNTANHCLIATLIGHLSAVNSLAFSPDGKTLASASDDLTIRLWDMAVIDDKKRN